jgi:hypothetical protein
MCARGRRRKEGEREDQLIHIQSGRSPLLY